MQYHANEAIGIRQYIVVFINIHFTVSVILLSVNINNRTQSNFFTFCPNNICSKLFLKITFKRPIAFYFFRNRGKFETGHLTLATGENR